MAVTVSSVQASAVVSEVKAASSITVQAVNVYLEAVKADVSVLAAVGSATVSYVFPTTVVDAAVAQASAYLDEAGWFKLYMDTISATEVFHYLMTKSFNDPAGLTDAVAKETTKELTEAVSFSDNIVITIIILRSFFDTFGVTDYQVLDVAKSLEDSVSYAETLLRDVDKTLNDIASVSDAPAKSITKPFADSLTSTDSSTRLVNKAAVDVVSTSDDKTFDVAKSRSDSISVTDSPSKDHTKLFVDSFFSSDAFTRVVNYNRNPNDAVLVTEALSKQFSRPLADSASISDADSRHFYKNVVGDSVSFSESFSYVIVGAESQLLNTYPLNTFTLNGP